MTIYEGAFLNTETNLDNESIQQVYVVRIYDTESPVNDNPYNVRYRLATNMDGTQDVFITMDPLPESITAAYFGYMGDEWTDVEINLSGPTRITIPEGDWKYSFLADDTRYEFAKNEVIELEMAGKPIVISTVDNDEDKFTPVKSKQVEISIFSSNTVQAANFAEGGDNRFYVEVESQVEGIIFMGWLSISDLQQDFMPDPNTIILTATDGLGFLKEEPLVNAEGLNPIGIHRIIDFLSWVLLRTGLQLDIKACMNIREETATVLNDDTTGEGHFYVHEYLDAKTFEDEIGVSEDCLTVLEKILGENSFITQYKGKWVILRIDELEAGHEYNFTRFDYTGEYIEKTTETYVKEIGVEYLMGFMNEDALVTYQRPFKSIIEKFNYEYPEELICNLEFERGEFVENLPDEPNEDGLLEQVKKFTLDCWEWQTRTAGSFIYDNFGGSPLPSSDVYVKKFYYDDAETHKELVIKAAAGSGAGVTYVQSSLLPVYYKDKIELAASVFYSNIGSSSGYLNSPVLVALFADNGDIYWWRGYNVATPNDPGQWVKIPSGNLLTNGTWYVGAAIDDPPLDMSFISPPVPVSGKLQIFLINEYGEEVNAHYYGVDITIKPYINGSYKRYTGQSNVVSSDNDHIKAVRETEVFITDAPRIAMKGSILILNEGGDATLPGQFYDAANFPAGPPDQENLMPFGKLQAFDVWNQFNRVFRLFEGTIDRTDSTTQLPDILHKYILRDINRNTTDGDQYRIFQLLHYEMDLHLCEWDCFLAEVFNTAVEKNYEGHELKYVTK